MKREELVVHTRGRGFTEITPQLAAFLDRAGMREGLCNVFLRHTSASLVLGENADPSVRRDLEAFLSRLVPDSEDRYEHDAEGPDDMPSHIRTALTSSSIVIPVVAGRPGLGTWQGLFLWEHRRSPHERRLLLSAWS